MKVHNINVDKCIYSAYLVTKYIRTECGGNIGRDDRKQQEMEGYEAGL